MHRPAVFDRMWPIVAQLGPNLVKFGQRSLLFSRNRPGAAHLGNFVQRRSTFGHFDQHWPKVVNLGQHWSTSAEHRPTRAKFGQASPQLANFGPSFAERGRFQ